jgi:hypothetical protein
MSDSNKKARHDEAREASYCLQQPLGGGLPEQSARLAPPERAGARRFLGLQDLFRQGQPPAANSLATAAALSAIVAGKPPSHAWFRGCDASSSRKEGFFALRIEHRADEDRGEEERILLFRSDQRGAVGKVVFSSRETEAAGAGARAGSSSAAEGCPVEASIKVLEIKEGPCRDAFSSNRSRSCEKHWSHSCSLW